MKVPQNPAQIDTDPYKDLSGLILRAFILLIDLNKAPKVAKNYETEVFTEEAKEEIEVKTEPQDEGFFIEEIEPSKQA